MSDRTVVIFATLLILQPIDWVKLIYALCNPDYVAGKSLAGYYFSIAFDVQKNGTFLETVRMNMWEGQLANMTWALEHGRILQTPGYSYSECLSVAANISCTANRTNACG